MYNNYDESDEIDYSSDDEDFSYPSDIWKNFQQRKIKSTTLKSLRSIALGNIGKNIEFWMEYLPKDPHKSLYVISPFDVLSSKDTMDILSSLVETHKFKPCHLNLIFHQYLHDMNFDILPNGWNYIKTMYNRCKRIKRLRVTNSKISKEYTKRIPTVYPGIEELHLGHPHQNLIANLQNCTNLKSFHFTADSSLSLSKMQLPPSIQSLSMKHLEVTKEESQHLWRMLEELKLLTRLSVHGSVLQFSTLIREMKFPQLKALDLSNCSGLESESLVSILDAVINVADLNLSGASCIDSRIFNSIEKFKKLTILKVAYLNILFDNIKFCLKTVCSGLITLDLSGNLAVDIDFIRMYCANLENLYLSQCTFLNPDFFEQRLVDDERNQIFCTKLKILELDSVHTESITDNNGDVEPIIGDGEFNTRIFSTFCRLFSLHFMSKSNILSLKIGDGAFVSYILEHFEGASLENIDFSGCRGLTKEHVIKCLLKYSNLKTIRYYGCKILHSERYYLSGLIYRACVDVKCEGDFKFII